MSTLRLVLRELAGLFVDDRSLAVSIIGVIVLAAMAAAVEAPLFVTGCTLLAGCVLVLIVNVLGATGDRQD
jgi:uncharacterized membrane protein